MTILRALLFTLLLPSLCLGAPHEAEARLRAEADRPFARGAHLRDPERSDVVRVLGARTRHAALTEVEPGESFAFQGRVFRTRQAATGGVEYAYTGQTLSQVTRVYQRQADTLIDLTVRDEATGALGVISGTPEHPFFVPARGAFVDMGDLGPGTVLQTAEGSGVRVVTSARRHGDFTVHNLEVEGTHTYRVSAPDAATPAVLVHNTCGNLPGSTPSPALKGSPYHPDSVASRVAKPEYRANPAHDPKNPNFNRTKSPEPADAKQVYDSAVRADWGTYYGRGSNGNIYRYFSDNTGAVHFSGTMSPADIPGSVLRQLGK